MVKKPKTIDKIRLKLYFNSKVKNMVKLFQNTKSSFWAGEYYYFNHIK